MPKSKRAKVVPLTQTKKKTRDNKEKLVGLVRDCVDEFSCAYVFRYENMRNATLKELRDKLHGSARCVAARTSRRPPPLRIATCRRQRALTPSAPASQLLPGQQQGAAGGPRAR